MISHLCLLLVRSVYCDGSRWHEVHVQVLRTALCTAYTLFSALLLVRCFLAQLFLDIHLCELVCDCGFGIGGRYMLHTTHTSCCFCAGVWYSCVIETVHSGV
jgi:hypothetical protein